MKNRKNKNAITLLALVITIVIMLLLAGVAIQMTMGENGLIAKSEQAQKAQAKAELYETVKLSYINLKAKVVENGQSSPQAELALSTTEFTNKYNVVGDDITDKKGNVIDTKANVLNVIQGTVAGGFSSGTTQGGTSSAESWPKTVGGVTIPEEDKDKMILKVKTIVPNAEVKFYSSIGYEPFGAKVKVDYGTGDNAEITSSAGSSKIYNTLGEYIVKVENVKDFTIFDSEATNKQFEVEILQWGKIRENNEENRISFYNVKKIYEPEPDKIPIEYYLAEFTEIPEWLFSKKITSTKMGAFVGCDKITTIPENLFKYNVSAKSFYRTFYNCNITTIPENLFKYNINAEDFENAFADCPNITEIPENLFKYNVNAKSFGVVFRNSKITTIPENLFKYNTNVTSFFQTFQGCSRLNNIPNKIIEYAKQVKQRGGQTSMMFMYCTSASNYSNIPSYMK